MKPKRKTTATIKKPAKKPVPCKPIMLVDKTIVTTKQKTYTTIQDHFQINELRPSIRMNKNAPQRLSCLQKMGKCDLSPFSSPEVSSLSPKARKAKSPFLKQEKEKKNGKSKPQLIPEKPIEKKRAETTKRETKNKAKMTKEESNHFAYQNLVIRKLKEKKITELSDQSSSSIPKLKKFSLNIKTAKQTKDITEEPRSKTLAIREIKLKIYEKYKKQYPTFKKEQMSFLCSIVLIQRFWRQHRIKNIISQYLSPRLVVEQQNSADSQRQNTFSKLDITVATQEHTSQLIKKYHLFNNGSSEKKRIFEKDLYSTEIHTEEKCMRNLNLKDLELDSELSQSKQIKMVKLVQCLRDISFYKTNKKSTTKSKINVFNMAESLSQKCLMQQFYLKLFKDSPNKKNNFQIFSSKKDEKNLQRSIELINTMKSPEKIEIIEIEQRFQTEFQCQENQSTPHLGVEHAQACIQTQLFIEKDDNKELNTLKQLNLVSEGVISLLLAEFSQQFHSFTTRSILKKKKKARLPGLKISSNSIREYLQGLIAFMMENYEQEVVKRFNLINPLSFLKIHHEYDQSEEMEEEDDDEFNLPIVPHTLFYQYQIKYQDEKFVIPEEDKKYSNFLEGLIKIHNLLLVNCFSEMLEKTRIDKVVLPWDNKYDAGRHKEKRFAKKNLEAELSKIISTICSCAFMRVGQFHKSLQDEVEERKILLSINQEYKSEGNDWTAQYQYLQTRLQLTKHIEQCLLNQVMDEMMIFF